MKKRKHNQAFLTSSNLTPNKCFKLAKTLIPELVVECFHFLDSTKVKHTIGDRFGYFKDDPHRTPHLLFHHIDMDNSTSDGWVNSVMLPLFVKATCDSTHIKDASWKIGPEHKILIRLCISSFRRPINELEQSLCKWSNNATYKCQLWSSGDLTDIDLTKLPGCKFVFVLNVSEGNPCDRLEEVIKHGQIKQLRLCYWKNEVVQKFAPLTTEKKLVFRRVNQAMAHKQYELISSMHTLKFVFVLSFEELFYGFSNGGKILLECLNTMKKIIQGIKPDQPIRFIIAVKNIWKGLRNSHIHGDFVFRFYKNLIELLGLLIDTLPIHELVLDVDKKLELSGFDDRCLKNKTLKRIIIKNTKITKFKDFGKKLMPNEYRLSRYGRTEGILLMHVHSTKPNNKSGT
jgi:hypothetical protein